MPGRFVPRRSRRGSIADTPWRHSGASCAGQIPPALKPEHEELHCELIAATKAGGRTGEAAEAVANLMYPHFASETGG
ncbi:hypothetical protein E4O86_01025 [Rhizobiales bacterium L72]|uniref:Uncharacterized protein n=1 Tax=Propylenella binzhouense TaxID=2555902 RepID=A0A964T0W6_9HYPH|nr:hypothetical protein [Propylenella binzhouense]